MNDHGNPGGRAESRVLTAAPLPCPVRPDSGYAGTRRFYERMGFLPLEEILLWGEDTPA